MRLNSNECSAAIPSPFPSAGGDTTDPAAASAVRLQCSSTSSLVADAQAHDDDEPVSACGVDDTDCLSDCSDDSEDVAEMAALEAYFTTTTPSVPLAVSRPLQSSSSAAASVQGQRQRHSHGAPPLSPQPIVPAHVRSLVIPASPLLLGRSISGIASSVESSRPSSSGAPQHPQSALLHARLTVLPSAPPTPEIASVATAERSFAAHFHLAAESGRYSSFPTSPPQPASSSSSSSSSAATSAVAATSAAAAAASAAAAAAAAASTSAAIAQATVLQLQLLHGSPLRGAIETTTPPLHHRCPAVVSAAGTANSFTVAPLVVAQRLPSAAVASSVATSAAAATAAAPSLSSHSAAALVAVSPAAAPVLTTAPALAQSLFQQRLNAAAALASASAVSATNAAAGTHTNTKLLHSVAAMPVSA
jgi:hypothetical protein